MRFRRCVEVVFALIIFLGININSTACRATITRITTKKFWSLLLQHNSCFLFFQRLELEQLLSVQAGLFAAVLEQRVCNRDDGKHKHAREEGGAVNKRVGAASEGEGGADGVLEHQQGVVDRHARGLSPQDKHREAEVKQAEHHERRLATRRQAGDHRDEEQEHQCGSRCPPSTLVGAVEEVERAEAAVEVAVLVQPQALGREEGEDERDERVLAERR